MPHRIEPPLGREKITFIGIKPWHGQDTELPAGQPLKVWRIVAGLDFTFKLGSEQFLGNQLFTDRRAMCRFDTLFRALVKTWRGDQIKRRALETCLKLAA